MDTEKPTLSEKLRQVMEAVTRVEKRGENTFHRYKYATESDLVEAVRGELTSRGIRTKFNVTSHQRVPKSAEKGFITDIMVTWSFVDVSTGDCESSDVPGCGEDSGDKGLYKALTGSEKYWLMKTFLIPTGDDPEKDEKGLSKAEMASLPDGFKPFARTLRAKVATAPAPTEPAPTNGDTEISGVLENVSQNTDDKGWVWTSGFIDGRRIYTKDDKLGNDMLRWADCDCTVAVKHAKKPNDFQLISIK
jgi:hypothetical protein